MDKNERDRYRTMAVNAISGHLSIPDAVYELGAALEKTLDSYEQLSELEAKIDDFAETLDELTVKAALVQDDIKAVQGDVS